MSGRTDTARLEWMAQTGAFVIGRREQGEYVRIVCDDCGSEVAKAPDMRHAIDAAMDAEERG